MVRCAIYTRKSSEEGLEQSFNSLDAQREACQAYIQSQRHEGWKVLPARYDDGGYSGGNMERPALKKLLEDIAAKQIDTVVVYKVDRLTRSLADFAKIVEQFDRQGVSFVSVTQQFNTTTSMGRLTLNVLLSFAQFEREVTGERIRDKVAASKRKGMWMGGVVPLGYDVVNRRLDINPKEADTVREIYRSYLDLGCVSKLRQHLERVGIRSKDRVSRAGRRSGGGTISRGALYEILKSPLYIGEVHYQGSVYAGQHEAILAHKIWNQVQTKLKENLQAPRRRTGIAKKSLLTGLLYDSAGHPFVPTHSAKKGKRYRYYTSQAVISGSKLAAGGPTRLPAEEIENLVVAKLQSFLKSPQQMQEVLCAPDATPSQMKRAMERAKHWVPKTSEGTEKLISDVVRRIVVRDGSVELELNSQVIRRFVLGETSSDSGDHQLGDVSVSTQADLKRCGGEVRLLLPPDLDQTARNVPSLVKAAARAHDWVDRIMKGDVPNQRAIAAELGVQKRYIGHIIRLAFLAPDITEAILDGRQPPQLKLQQLLPRLPITWTAQRDLLLETEA